MLSRTQQLIKKSQTPTRSFITVVQQYEYGVKLFLGKYQGLVDPGLRLNLPILHNIVRISNREIPRVLPKQALMSRDNVTFYIDSTVQYRVVDPEKAFFRLNDIDTSVTERCKTEIRNTMCAKEINSILHDRDQTTTEILNAINGVSKSEWGIEVSSIQIQDLSVEESMRRAMATKAEADRNAEAKIINAQADVQTAQKYSEAASIYSENPLTMRLRELQAVQSLAKSQSNTVFMFPTSVLDLVHSLSTKPSPTKSK